MLDFLGTRFGVAATRLMVGVSTAALLSLPATALAQVAPQPADTQTPADAQTPADPQAPAAPPTVAVQTGATEQAPATSDGDIIVTATKQESALSRVPLSIAVITRDSLDEQSIRNPEDLSRITPSLVITNGNNSAGSNVYIRGIASNVGAPTVGIYLDDVPITRRNASSNFNGNGTNFPQFFDLERVEVLRGPQGTLYGGSSIGGTIRFVLPEPSLGATRVRAKAEVATTKEGGESYELGASVSTALIPDTLGLVASVYGRRLGGYLDHVSRFTGRVLEADTNSQESFSGRVAMLWAATPNLRIKPSVYFSRDRFNDSDNYWTNTRGYTQAPRTTNSNPAAGITGPNYTAPGYTIPSYNVFGPYRTGSNCNVGENFQNSVTECVIKEKRESELLLPSLTVGLDLDNGAAITSVTSYTHDTNVGVRNNSFQDLFLLGSGGRVFDANIRNYADPFSFNNRRKGFTQELRVATDSTQRFSAVFGGFYSNFDTESLGRWVGNLDELTRAIFGRTVEQYFSGVNPFPPSYFDRFTDQTEKEFAVFGEATFKVTDRLQVLAGLRVSETTFRYFESTFGSTVRRATPTAANGGLTDGEIVERPVTPKFGVKYQIDERNMLYANAAKGFRAGGVSSRPIGPACEGELASLGFPNLPAIPFESDSVWSYEVGAKLRPFGEVLSLDASAYRIDWKDTQVNYRLNCQATYVANAGSARSQGFDFVATLRPVEQLSLTGSVSYVDAKYDALSLTVNNVTTRFINQGDRAPIPKWSYNLGGQFRQPLNNGMTFYARADHQYTGTYPRLFGPGTNGFFPDVYRAESTDFTSARLGIEMGDFDLSAFVNNVFNSQDDVTQLLNFGRGNCSYNASGAITSCARDSGFLSPTTFRPRTVGLTMRYTM